MQDNALTIALSKGRIFEETLPLLPLPALFRLKSLKNRAS